MVNFLALNTREETQMGVFKKGRQCYIDYYVKGVRKRKKIGPSKQVADLALAQVKVKIAKGEYLGIYEDKKLTFRQFAPEYLAYAQANKSPSSYRRDQVAIEHWLTPSFGERYLFHFTVAEVERYKQARLAEVKPSTVNKELNCLKAMLNKAVIWRYLKEHPLRGVKGLKEPPGRLRYLTPEESTWLLEACDTPPYLRPIVDLAMHTGMRRSEILALCWSDLDLRRRTITLTHTKNNERRVIPINDTVAATLKAWPRAVGSDALFPELNGPMVTRSFWRACRKAEVPNLRLHDLRHTFASYLAMGGFNLRTIQQLLGHKDLRMTSRYAHLSADHLSQAVKSLDTALGVAVQALVEG
jgi:integrase